MEEVLCTASLYLVCVVGFEPTASEFQARPSTRLTLHTDKIGVPPRTRTLTNGFGDRNAAITPEIHNTLFGIPGRIRTFNTQFWRLLFCQLELPIYKLGVASEIRTHGFTVLQTVALGLSATATFNLALCTGVEPVFTT